MARPIWTGTISFGLLHIPIRLFAGEHSVDLHLRMLDGRDKSRVRYERVNAETGKEVPWKDIVKAFEYRKGSYAVIDEETLKRAAPQNNETIDLETFVDRESIDPRYFEKPYLLVPDRKADKPYVLLRDTLKGTGKVGIARVVIRTRQYLAMLMPLEHALVLILMRFPQELVDVSEYNIPEGEAVDYKISQRELDMAAQLIESMSGDWRPEDYKDDFRDRLRKIIEERVAQEPDSGEHAVAPDDERPTQNADDFMELLKQSLKSQRNAQPSGRSSRGSTRRRSSRDAGTSAKEAKAPATKSGSRKKA